MRHFSFLFFLRESDDVIVYSAADRVLKSNPAFLPESSRSTGNGCSHLKSGDGKLPNCVFVTADLSVCRYAGVSSSTHKTHSTWCIGEYSYHNYSFDA